MALEQITVQYLLALDKAKADFNGFVGQLQQGEQKIANSAKSTTNQIISEEAKAHQKRAKFLKEEIQDLGELQKRKKLAYLPEEIKQYNDRIRDTQNRIKLLKGDTEELAKTNNNLVGTFKSIAGAVGIAFGVQQLLGFSKELLELGYKARGVNKAFNAIATSQDLAALRANTGFGVSDLQLKQLAVRANTFKISLETLPTLLQFATVRAAETGQEVDYLVNSIIDGIGRQSPLILDNLGISAKELQTEFKKTGDFAGAVGTIIQKEMGKSVTSIENAVPPLQRIAAAWDNLKEKAGGALVTAIDLNNEYLTTLIEVASTQENIGKSALTIATGGIFITEEDIRIADAALLKLKEYNAEIERLLNAKGMDEGEIISIISKINTALLTQAGGFNAVTFALEKYNLALAKAGETAIPPITTLKNLNEELKLLKERFEMIDMTAPEFSALRNEIKALEERIESITNPTNAGSIARLEKDLSKLQERLNNTTSVTRMRELEREIYLLTVRISALKNLDTNLGTEIIDESLPADIDKANAAAARLLDNLKLLNDTQLKDLQKEIDAATKSLTEMANAVTDEMWEDFKKNQDKAKEAQKEFNELLKSGATQLVSDLTGLFTAIGAQQDEAINRQLEGERTRAQEHFGIMKGIWQQQLERGEITKEELFNQETAYNEKLTQLELRQAEIRKQQLRKQAIAEKANAGFQILIGAASGIGKTIGNVGLPAAIPLVALIGGLAAAQLAILAATPIPEFAKGVIGLQGKGTGTSDDIPAMLSKGESVITAKATDKHKDALSAINKGDYDKYVQQKYIMPILQQRKEKQSQSFAQNLADSMRTQGFDDTMLIHETRKNKRVTIGNAEQIGNATANALDKRRYFNNRT